jgi:hypothetical protein
MSANKVQNVINVIEDYFYGVYLGDLEKLRNAFHPQTILYGDINGEPYLKTLEEYLEGVKNRKSPKEVGEDFKMKIVNIDFFGNNAIAKLCVPIFGIKYTDYLSLTTVDEKWKIVNKLFTNDIQ